MVPVASVDSLLRTLFSTSFFNRIFMMCIEGLSNTFEHSRIATHLFYSLEIS